ncbi:MAG: PQQ-binding-like beta-propeller repeat protein [Lentisphaerae bacterium]|nr:PQQ-binding-like beta-propeller repeat protein [Lentisphaerota bacterium]
MPGQNIIRWSGIIVLILLALLPATRAQDAYEPDNTVGTASNIAVGASQTNRTIHVADDIDYVSFNADLKHAYGVGMTNIQIEIYGIGPSAGLLTLYDTNGTSVITTGSSETEIWVRMLAATAGTYYARAESDGAAGSGSYHLVLSDYGTGDGYEMDNSPGTASNFIVGVSQPRSLHWNGDTDYANFTNTANHLYLFEVTNYTDMISITLYDTDGTNALASDDTVFGDGSFEYLLVSTGMYYVSVSPVWGATATYDLAISDEGVLTGDAYEPDNSVATASNITVGVSQTNRSIHWAGDVDYVAVPVTTAHRYVIAATNVGASLDIAVTLYGTNGTTGLGSADLGANGESEFLTNVCTITGTNFIRLESVDGTGAYSLVVTDIGSVTSDIYEVDDSVGLASIITPGAPHTNHTIHLTSDVDYLQFTAQADRYYTIETYALDWGLDTYIYLYDSTGTNLLASDNDSGSGPASWLQYKIQAAGTYYIKVNAYNSASVGYYSIRVTDTRIREKAWTTRSSLGALSSPAIGLDGLIYVGCYDSNLYAFAVGGTTAKVWRAGSYIASSPAIASNGSVYIGSHDDRFYCFGTNGGTNWISGTTFGDITGSPALSFDGRIYIGSIGFRFLSFNPNGTTNWTINLPDAARGVSPAIGTNGTIYIGCDATNFYSFNPNGTTNWVAKLPSAVRSSAAIDANGVIYVARYSGNLYAFNPTNGATNHVWTTGKTIDGSSPVIGTNGDIYIGAYSGTTNGALYSFNQDGTTNWSIQFTNVINSTPLIGCDGTVYIGTRGGYFYAFNPDGSTNFMTLLNYDISASPVMDTNGLLYVAAENHLFAIFGTSYGAGGLADSPWPMFLHDARHTGALPPPAPTGVSASDGTFTNQVRLTWSVATNTTSYYVYRSTINNSITAVHIAAAVSNQYDDTSAVPGTTYYYWVKAVNHSGSSQFSASDSGWRASPAPSGVAASDGTFADKVRVTWLSVPGALLYRVWSNTANDTNTAALAGLTTNILYDHTAADAGLLRYYWVQASNELDMSAWSAPDSGWRLLVAPTGLTASDGAYTDQVAISWSASTNATAYSLWRGPANDTNVADFISQTTTTTFADASAATGVIYYYWVKATNTLGASDFSAPDTGWRAAATPADVPTITVQPQSLTRGVGQAASFSITAGGTAPLLYQWQKDGGDLSDQTNATYAIAAVSTADAGDYRCLALNAYGAATSAVATLTVTSPPSPAASTVAVLVADFDGDGLADPALYVLPAGAWYLRLSARAYELSSFLFGGAGYAALAADFDGDGLADPGVYQAASGDWLLSLSTDDYQVHFILDFGGSDYDSAAGDYDGDNKVDPAVYSSSNGAWRAMLSAADYVIASASLGGEGYVAVPHDYDGDRKTDPGVYRSADGLWLAMLSGSGYTVASLTGLGSAAEEAVAGDYDADLKVDPAVYAAASGLWRGMLSASGYAPASLADFGGSGYIVGAADYDGDGQADPIIYEIATGIWFIKLSASGYATGSTASGYAP